MTVPMGSGTVLTGKSDRKHIRQEMLTIESHDAETLEYSCVACLSFLSLTLRKFLRNAITSIFSQLVIFDKNFSSFKHFNYFDLIS